MIPVVMPGKINLGAFKGSAAIPTKGGEQIAEAETISIVSTSILKSEPPPVYWRLGILRGYSHGHGTQVFTRSTGTSGSTGKRAIGAV